MVSMIVIVICTQFIFSAGSAGPAENASPGMEVNNGTPSENGTNTSRRWIGKAYGNRE